MDWLLYQSCIIKRANAEEDGNSYIDLFNDTEIGTYPCRITRMSPTTTDQQVNSTITGSMRAYFHLNTDIQEGDVIECDDYNHSFKVAFVYKPNHHHIEADLNIIPKDV